MKGRTMKYLAHMLTLPLLAVTLPTDGSLADLYDVADSPFSTFIAKRPGDLLTVIIDEQSETSDQADRKQDRKSEAEFNLKKMFFPGLDITDGLSAVNGEGDPIGFSWDSDSKFKSDADYNSNHRFKARLQVRLIEEVFPGQFIIRGYRTINLNGKEKRLYISGVIRQRDISTSNTIYSHEVADAAVEIEGETAMRDVRQGLLNRIMNFIF
jgi:flagellar L-ring protein precursor FlgH